MLAVTVCLAALPLVSGHGTPSETRGRDAILAQQAARSLGAGELLPRWAPDLGRGYGSPWFLFHAPAAYLLPGACILLGLPAALGVTLALLTTLAGAAWLAFLLGRQLWGPPAGALLAVLYVLSPWHLSRLDSLPGSLALCWPPLALWALRCFTRRQKIGYAAAATLALAALPLTDLPAALGLGPALGLYLLLLARWRGRLPSGLDLVFIGVGAASMAAFFWFPAWWETSHLLATPLPPAAAPGDAPLAGWQRTWFDPGLVLGGCVALAGTFLARRWLDGAGRWILPALALLLVLGAHFGAPAGEGRAAGPAWDVPAWFRPDTVVSLPPPRSGKRFPPPPGCQLDQERGQATLYFFDAVCAEPAVMEARLFHYPGWTVHVDNQEQEPDWEPRYGTLRIPLAAGVQRVKVSFGHTPLRRYAHFLSLAALVLAAAWWLSRRPGTENDPSPGG